MKYRKFSDFFKEFLEKNDFTLEYVGEKTQTSFSMIGHYKNNRRQPSNKFIEKFLKAFHFTEKEKKEIKLLVEMAKSQTLKKYVENGKFSDEINSEKVITQKLEVYVLDTSSNGILREKYEEVFIMTERFKFINNSFVLEIKNDKLEPKLLDGDKVLVQKLDLNWKDLNDKVVVVDYKGEKIARFVKFIDGEPVLFSFTGIEKNIKVNTEVKYLGVVTDLINRKL